MGSTNHEKVVAVTGGAHGIGKAVAMRFAAEGFKVCILDIDMDASESLVKTLRAQNFEARYICMNLADVASIEAGLESCVKEFSRLDVLVCSGGVISAQPYLEVTQSEWDSTFAINVRGLFFCNQRAARQMGKTGGGRIINITSPASHLGLPFYTAYAASKAAVDSITRSGAVALADYNIRVNCLAPGRVDTGMQEKSERAGASLSGLSYEQFVESRTRSLPLKRRATPDEIAKAVLFLALVGSDYMTGSRLNISGGLELS